ncbi:MAG: NAD(P)(+) transhydrogenase (Re/Si-specific) subunit alpha, partial [Ruminococcus sp.]|nr:NAD(P)(+) transhydrogenase (Re/Si-specific) subunit alpha [Ruminococcus sp.]MBQ9543378.1 NAD(P)(+) transhydrogenase (Re/Si-specific) subunit alpha [Ruminococcus sp.]MBR0529570.1 NAD(P)(+) transhydrogenase (Re/Si-specific) subunit alpha [Ruminococcus sp.]
MKQILVCRETDPRETRVALIPDDIKKLANMGYSVKVVRGAGEKSGFN